MLLLFAYVGLLVHTTNSFAQEVTAVINGIINDPTGAPILGAKVTVTDMDRGTVLPTTTNADGFYNLPRVPVGRYEIRVEMPGFETAVRSGIVLQLNQTAKVDLKLSLGQQTQTVTVNSGQPLLEAQSTQLGTVIDARQNVQLPLATRNYVQLTLLTAGAATPNPTGFKGSQTSFNSDRPYINGNREQTNNFLLDGIDNNQVSDNYVGYAPSVDSIEEFNEITQNASPEFGNFMGGITSVSTKAGTNQYHGDAFEFFRNDKLNANEWMNNLTGLPKNPLRWNEFGGSLGGPIKKNKLFFFADYQGSRYDQPGVSSQISVLTAQERQGNFSQLLSGSNPTQLYDPYSIGPDGKRQPFAGNIIPHNLLSPATLQIINSPYYPQALNNNVLNNQVNVLREQTNGNQGDARVDYNISDKDRLFARYSQANIDFPQENSQPLLYNSYSHIPIYNGVLDYSRTINANIVNDVRVGVNYVTGDSGTTPGTTGNLPETAGIGGVPISILPAQNFTGGFAHGIGSSDIIQELASTVIQYEDTAIITKGTHTMHVGFQGFRYRLDNFYAGNNGVAGLFNYNGQFTATSGQTFGGGSGQPEADFLLGLPSEVGLGPNNGTTGQRANVFAAFYQDTWRISPTFTLNYGLRYELHTPWIEVDNRQVNFAPFSGQIEYAGQSTYYNNNRALYNQYNGPLNFQPRLGFAWNPHNRHTVIRASYTLSSFMEGSGTNLRLTTNPPFGAERDALYTSATSPATTTTLTQGFSIFDGAAANPFAGASLRLWDPNVRPAVSNQWNFTVQQQLGNSTTVQVAYVGQKNDHLIAAQAYSQSQLLANGTIAPSPYLSGNPALLAELGPNASISGTESNGSQSYNALQVTLQRRLAQGVEGQVFYTYSKCMTNSIGFYGEPGTQASNQSAYAQNLYNRSAEWGPCYYDLTHNVSANVSYDLPFGHNRQFGNDMNKVLNAFVGDWQVNGILSFHDGFPLTISAPDNSGTNSRGARANCIAPATVYGEQNYGGSGGGFQWFNPAAYGPEAPGTFGTCGVGTVRGPGIATADLSASKKFNFTEHQNLELRGEFINAFNHPILNAPTTSLGSTLGLIQTSQGARNIQLALKYNF
ncbi:MAG TPA: carboxypeptidase regulatory-like domain-containing protein [Bryobacteraceae bacterium]|nr:carboxypeptidase regulatory-like domain-containing protein [Bryobacteraceae bacterium]